MTGQVKEDILNRWSELGVGVENGQISFCPTFLSDKEWLTQESIFEYLSLQGNFEQLKLSAGELAFTYCQVPIVYKKSGGNGIQVGLKEARKSPFRERIIWAKNTRLPSLKEMDRSIGSAWTLLDPHYTKYRFMRKTVFAPQQPWPLVPANRQSSLQVQRNP